MDGVAIINFNGTLGTYLTEGTAVSNKAARINQKKEDPNKNSKREQLVASWLKLRPSVKGNDVAQKEETKKASFDIKGMLAYLGIVPIKYDLDFVANGKRKIKTVPKVADGARIVNYGSEKEVIEKTVEAPKEVSNQNIVNETDKVVTNELKEEPFKAPEFAPLPETRTQRLERTGEIPKVSTPVINAPERFATPEPQFDQDFYGNQASNFSRVERNVDEYQSREESIDNSKLELGKVEKDLDRIASINHGVKTSSEELRKAYENCEKSEKAKRAAQLETNRLEAELAMAQKQLDEQNAKQIADLNARTQANQEEVMGYTMHSEDLRKQLEEIRSQLAGGENTFRR